MGGSNPDGFIEKWGWKPHEFQPQVSCGSQLSKFVPLNQTNMEQ
jgi:hypothetical protein